MNKYSMSDEASTLVEQQILSIILHDNNIYDDICHKIHVSDFGSSTHKEIFQHITSIISQGKSVDKIILLHHMKDTVIDLLYLDELTAIASNKHMLSSYMEMFIEISIRRKITNLITIVSDGLESMISSSECLEILEKGMLTMNESQSTDTVIIFKDSVKKLYDTSIERINNPQKITGITTGIQKLDDLTSGFKGGQMIVLAGRPSVGKTAFALNLVTNYLTSDIKTESVLFISLEMPPEQLAMRVTSSLTNIPLYAFTHGNIQKIDIDELSMRLPFLSSLPLLTYDSFSINIPKLRSLLRQHKRVSKIGMVVIDYLQLIESINKNGREQQISQISRSLKLLAKEINIPIIVLSQMSRDVEKRVDNVPRLSDLRDSGAIEQDADLVLFLYRDDSQPKGSMEIQNIICKIAKNRNGSLGDIPLFFKGSINKFFESNPEFIIK